MVKQKEIYKCNICGNIIEVLHGGIGELVCCGQPMQLFEEKNADSTTEKHVPFIKRHENKYIVKVGEATDHPMEEKHYIEWIELTVDLMVYKKYLKPGDMPIAEFEVPEGSNVSSREFCNIHGLWKS